jgi:hypothetical protein
MMPRGIRLSPIALVGQALPAFWAIGAAEVHDMAILAVIGFLALFSLISYELGTDDWRQAGYTPLDDGMFWMRLGNR